METNEPKLESWHPDLREIVPATRAFTLRSDLVGGTFAIWVTVPPGYRPDGDPLPVVYVLDGNTQLALTAPLGTAMMMYPPQPIRPFLQVTIGYHGDDARNFLRVRSRDLVPPGEPYPHQMAEHLRPRVERGVLTEEEYRSLLTDLGSAAADRFLAFIADELHPRITERWPVDARDVGLFGYSFGALFSLYAFLTASHCPFTAVGASSPGILSPDSEIFRLYEQRRASTARRAPHRLHLTLHDTEMSSPFPLYRDLAANYLALVNRIRVAPLPGLRATSEILRGQTHTTGIIDAYRSFVLACYAAAGHPPASEIVW